MTVALTPAEAEAKIQQIESARDQATQKLSQIEDAQSQMLTASWRGGSASSYGNVAQQQHEEFGNLIKALNQVVEKGSEHMRSISSADQT